MSVNATRVVINKAAEEGDGNGADIFRLTDIEPQFVSLVTAGANRQKKFQVVKADACILCLSQEPCSCPAWARKGDQTEKAVPAEDATDEEKREAQEARAKQYGVEALEGADANLSYPSGDPTIESLYGDPVNLKYPLGKAGNQPDVGRTKNALGRFKQAHDTYSKEASKAKVYTRIVEAALAQGVKVAYDPEDPIDKLLPENVVARLTEVEGDNEQSNADKSGSTKGSGTVDFASWLDDASASVGEQLTEASIEVALSIAADATSHSEKDQPARVDKSQSAPSVEQLLEKSRQLEATIEKERSQREAVEKKRDEIAKELDALKEQVAKLRKERGKLRTQLSKLRNGVGGSTSLVTGNATGKVAKAGDEHSEPEDAAWAAGGDLAAKVAKGK